MALEPSGSSSEKQALTRMQCMQELCDKMHNNKNMGWVIGSILLFFTIVIAIAIAVKPSQLYSVQTIIGFPLMIVLTGVFYAIGIANTRTLRKIKKLDFCITTEICTGKYYQKDFKGFRRNGYYLLFSGNQRYRLDFDYKGMGRDALFEQADYEHAVKGKEYYTFRIDDGKIIFALPADSYSFSPDEFEQYGDRWYPKKTTAPAARGEAPRAYSMEEDIRRKSEEQYQNGSPKRRAAVDAFHEARKKVNVMQMTVGIISGSNIVTGWVFLALCSFSRVFTVINMIFQTALFAFLSVYWFRTGVRARKALEAIGEDYADYPNLRRAHNGSFLFVFVLILDLFYYVVILMLMIHFLIS